MSGHGLPRSIPDVYARLDALEGGSGSVSWDDVTDKPSTFPPTIGTTADTAAAGDHTHTFASLAGTVADATGADLQAILEDLASRIAALESA